MSSACSGKSSTRFKMASTGGTSARPTNSPSDSEREAAAPVGPVIAQSSILPESGHIAQPELQLSRPPVSMLKIGEPSRGGRAGRRPSSIPTM